jgi:hypothetical protein
MLNVNNFRGRFVEQMLMLSSNFRCDQIYKYERLNFGHTVVLLRSDLDVQQTHLRFSHLNIAKLENCGPLRVILKY